MCVCVCACEGIGDARPIYFSWRVVCHVQVYFGPALENDFCRESESFLFFVFYSAALTFDYRPVSSRVDLTFSFALDKASDFDIQALRACSFTA